MGIGALAVAVVVMLPSCEANKPPVTKIVTDTIFDTDYLHWTFFSLDTPTYNHLPEPRHPITNLRVYIDDGNPQNNIGSQRCRATVCPFSPGDSARYGGDVFDGYFDLKMLGTDYVFYPTSGIIQFVTPISSNYTIAIAYDEGPDTIGGYNWWNPVTGESLLVLKLIKPMQTDPTSQTWNLGMKNVYGLGAKNIKLDSVKLVRWLPWENPREVDENGRRFLYLVGLDPDDDGVVVWPQFESSAGYLICGYSLPFVAESLTVKDSIYDPHIPYYLGNYRFVVKYTLPDTSGARR